MKGRWVKAGDSSGRGVCEREVDEGSARRKLGVKRKGRGRWRLDCDSMLMGRKQTKEIIG